MRLSVCIPIFSKGEPLTQAIHKIKALGFDAAEIWRFPKDGDIDSFSRALKETGIELIAMCTDCFELTDPSKKQEFLEQLEKCCIVANRLGCRRLITQGGKNTGAPFDTQYQSMLSTLRDSVPILKKYQIVLILEPLNTRIDHKDAFLSKSDVAFNLVKEAGSEYIKVLFDIYHQQIMGEDVESTIIQNHPLIAHLHCASSNGRHEPDQGALDYPSLLRKIENAGYQGVCGLEYKPLLDPTESLIKIKNFFLHNEH